MGFALIAGAAEAEAAPPPVSPQATRTSIAGAIQRLFLSIEVFSFIEIEIRTRLVPSSDAKGYIEGNRRDLVSRRGKE
jgi:hypothetical protein